MDRSYFQDLLLTIAERGRDLIGLKPGTEPATSTNLIALTEALLSGRGEASGVALADEIFKTYAQASPRHRRAFLSALASDFGPDLPALEAAARAFLKTKSDATLAEIARSAEPRRQELIRRLNLAPGGTHALVRMRADAMELASPEDEFQALDEDFKHLLASWFNRGFLVLRRIDWTTPANILEKIIRYEAVHTIQSWDDLRNRLEPTDRRCFAFFHPQLIDEPLIFVEVALTQAIPNAIAPLLAMDRKPISPAQATTAVFYSISNCQVGLKGVSFGNFLIKQVVEELKRDLPGLKTFVTLSPVTGFAKWLRQEVERPDSSEFVDAATKAQVRSALEPEFAGCAAPDKTGRDALSAAAAAYFLHARTASGRPLDPVARFHLGNGARLERINVNGDLSPKGLHQALGVMVNYLYDLDQIERNHEAFANSGTVVASLQVTKLSRLEPARRSLVPVSVSPKRASVSATPGRKA